MRKQIIVLFCILSLIGCVTFKSKPTSFHAPEDNPNHINLAGAIIACEILDSAEASTAQFNIDFNAKGVLPVRLAVRNNSQNEVKIQRSQIFGILKDNSYYNTLTLDQSLRDIEFLEAAKGAARGAMAGAVVGGAAGAAGGAIFGKDTDSTETGAAIGGAAGAIIGGLKGAESISTYITKEMQYLVWEDKIVSVGYLENGFIFLPKADYKKIEIGVLNTGSNKMESVTLNIKN